jgi:16S rRNA (guanine(966)-N(2))-methyltransferase RsmD
MRIIAGTKRGMKLLGPKSETSRPYTDRVKESLFSVLYKYGLLEDRAVADVFSGVGSMGLEALSRGAEFALFVEKDPKIGSILKQNIEKAGFTAQSKVIRANAFKIGAPVDFEGQKYSIIFVDPPYRLSSDAGEDSDLSRLLDLLPEQLTDDGIVIVRTNKRVNLQDRYGRLKIIERRKWGNMAVNILRETENEQ